MTRKIFRNLVDQQTARELFYEHINFDDIPTEDLPLNGAVGRVLVNNIYSSINVPPFDRAAMDGFAVLASDVAGANEQNPITLRLVGEVKAGYTFDGILAKGECVEISTGAPMPAGADSVVMVEYSNRQDNEVDLFRSVSPSDNTMAAGTDISLGELIVSRGKVLTSRELAIIAAIGKDSVKVIKLPKVGVFSSGDEIVPLGTELKPGKLFDINSTAVITTLLENGADPSFLGIIQDLRSEIKDSLAMALKSHDLVLISGGTSAGMGDMLYEVINELGEPGLLVHGIKVKPGKPTILAVCDGTPIVGLPGYPASALSILQLFVIPLVRTLAGLPPIQISNKIKAQIRQKFRSVEGRYEFKPVYLFRGSSGWIAFPVPGGSGAITSVSLADGFVQIPENTHFIESGTEIDVHLISDKIKPPAIQIIASHEFPLSYLKEEFNKVHPNSPVRIVDSSGGVEAVRRGEAHLAGVHLLDPEKGYNRWISEDEDLIVVPGYYRMQGLIVQKDNPKSIFSLKDLLRQDVVFLNRPKGSGTRILLDHLLTKMEVDTSDIEGYEQTAKSDISAAIAVERGYVDVSIGIQEAFQSSQVEFVELREEEYDFVVSKAYYQDNIVQKFLELLQSRQFKEMVDSLPGYRSK